MAPKNQKKRVAIVGGPSKFDFLLTIGFRKYPQQSIKLKLDDHDEEVETRIYTITTHDHPDKLLGEEGHWWYFVGCIDNLYEDGDTHSTDWVRGKYSTRTRTGWVEVLDLQMVETLHGLLYGG